MKNYYIVLIFIFILVIWYIERKHGMSKIKIGNEEQHFANNSISFSYPKGWDIAYDTETSPIGGTLIIKTETGNTMSIKTDPETSIDTLVEGYKKICYVNYSDEIVNLQGNQAHLIHCAAPHDPTPIQLYILKPAQNAIVIRFNPESVDKNKFETLIANMTFAR